MEPEQLQETVRDIYAQIFALRHFATGICTNLFTVDPDPIGTARRVAGEDIRGFDKGYEFGPVADETHAMLQRSLHHLDGLWKAVEEDLRRRGYPESRTGPAG